MLKRMLMTVIASLAVLATGSVARADFVIDTFTTPAPGVAYTLGGSVGDTYSRPSDAPSAGVTRSILVTQTQNDFGVPGQTTGIVGSTILGGRFTLATAPSTTANADIKYTYATPQDLSAGGTNLVFTFTSADLNIPFSVIVSDGTNTSTQVGTVSSPTSFTLPMSGFTGVNLSSVQSIEFLLNKNANTNASTASADFAISDVRITTPGVPAPPAAFLLLAAAPALGLVRVLRKKAPAVAA